MADGWARRDTHRAARLAVSPGRTPEEARPTPGLLPCWQRGLRLQDGAESRDLLLPLAPPKLRNVIVSGRESLPPLALLPMIARGQEVTFSRRRSAQRPATS